MRGVHHISLREPSGYGEAARRYMLGLQGLGVPVAWTPMVRGLGWGRGLGYVPFRDGPVGDPELDPLLNIPIPYDAVVVHLPPEYYPRWAQEEPGKTLIG